MRSSSLGDRLGTLRKFPCWRPSAPSIPPFPQAASSPRSDSVPFREGGADATCSSSNGFAHARARERSRRTDGQFDDRRDRWKGDRHIERRAAGCDGHPRRRSHDGQPRHGDERHGYVPVHFGYTGSLHGHVRAGGLCDHEANRHSGWCRFHGHSEHFAERGQPRGSGHRERRLAGGRCAVVDGLNQLRREETGGVAQWQQRPVGDAGGDAGGQDEPHRRGWQHVGHADHLHDVWHRRPAAVLRRDQRDGIHQRQRQLPGHERV